MKKKTYVLTISQAFPQTHKRKGEPTNFVDSIAYQDKIHTIRANYPLWEKRIAEVNAGRAILSVRVWEGKPYNSKQREVFAFEGVGIEKLEFPTGSILTPCINNGSHMLIRANLFKIAKHDGLCFDDFRAWFKGYDLTKPMAIIHFTNFRYAKP